MELLLAGVDRTVIALWLGHESIETTQIYLDANLAIKERTESSSVGSAIGFDPEPDSESIPGWNCVVGQARFRL